MIRHLLAAGAPRHRLWEIRAGHVILATGALERPIAFANNDRPRHHAGVGSAWSPVERQAIAPGTNGVVFTNNDDAYLDCSPSRRMPNVQVVDSRARPDGDLVKRAVAEGITVSTRVPFVPKVEVYHQRLLVKIAAYRKGQGRVITEKGRLRFHRHVRRLESGVASVVPQWRKDQV